MFSVGQENGRGRGAMTSLALVLQGCNHDSVCRERSREDLMVVITRIENEIQKFCCSGVT